MWFGEALERAAAGLAQAAQALGDGAFAVELGSDLLAALIEAREICFRLRESGGFALVQSLASLGAALEQHAFSERLDLGAT